MDVPRRGLSRSRAPGKGALYCSRTEDDTGEDEQRLLVNGVQVWGAESPGLNDRDTADLPGVPPVEFGTRARVELLDSDSPDDDDLLGRFYVGRAQLGLGELGTSSSRTAATAPSPTRSPPEPPPGSRLPRGHPVDQVGQGRPRGCRARDPPDRPAPSRTRPGSETAPRAAVPPPGWRGRRPRGTDPVGAP
ncbi:hypothetical protein [Streptomyces sp. NPDC085466]|uniref:hypothetical protein n=1 Tax=Streptomyces sp. NPDC085466 TaxID=3365725 RepID=UPI0037CF539E